MPSFSQTPAGTLECVMMAGCSISDSTPPRLSARVKMRVAERNRFALSRRVESSIDTAAEAGHLAACEHTCCDDRRGPHITAHAGMRFQETRHRHGTGSCAR